LADYFEEKAGLKPVEPAFFNAQGANGNEVWLNRNTGINNFLHFQFRLKPTAALKPLR